MKPAFEVGQRYRNRRGPYEVVSIDGNHITIRYTDGETQTVALEAAERIWRNIQLERTARAERAADASSQPADEQTRRGQVRRGRSKRTGSQSHEGFHGLQDGDFQCGVRGTTWRARTSLGGLLAASLSGATECNLLSYPVDQRAEVHIASPACYSRTVRSRRAKLVFALGTKSAWYGFTIERDQSPPDQQQDWTRFAATLRENATIQTGLSDAMGQYGFQWRIYAQADDVPVTIVAARRDTLLWDPEGVAEPISWTGFVDRLEALDTGVSHSVYLATRMDKEAAIALGPELPVPVVEVLCALLPLYCATAGLQPEA